MFLFRRLLAVLVVVSIAAAVAFASGFQLNEHGARAMAQGGAFAARAYDGSAIFFNPAGIAFIDRTTFYGGVTAIIPTVSFYGPEQQNSNAQTKSPSQFFNPVNFYFTYPLMDRLHIGLGVNNPYGLGSEWPDNWVGKFLTTKVELESYFFTPVVSYKILDNLSIAVQFSYVYGTVNIQKAIAVSSIALPNGSPHVNIDMTAKNGAGWGAGVMYKPTTELSIGASYRSSVKLTADGDATFSPNYKELGLPQGPASAKIELPGTAFVGVAYKVMSNLELEADYQWTQWTTYDQLAIDFKANNSSSVTPKNYNNSFILRFGGEYTIDQLHLRAGYLFDKSPVDAAYVDPTLPDANRNGINLGLGYDLSNHFSVDVAYLLLLFNERHAVNTIPEVAFDGTYHTRVNLIGLDFGYNF